MSTDLILHELTGSPNSVKVRMALGYKGLAYTREPVDLDGFPGNRAKIVEISTQPRLPVLQHGKTVIFDSKSILRYLDANFPDTPRLFSADYETLGEIEEYELWARTELGPPVGKMFGQAFSPEPDAEVCRQASAEMNECTGRIEKALADSPYLLGDAPTAADLACAPVVNLAMLPEAAAATSPIAAAFQKNFHLGDGRDKTRAWVASLVKYDAVFSAAT